MIDIECLSWNVQGQLNITGFTRFNKIKPYLEKTSADIICLQEMYNARLVLQDTNLLKRYNAYIPKSNTRHADRKTNGNIILSKYRISEAEEIPFPQHESKRAIENASRASIEVGRASLNIYNCHFPIFRTGISERLKQLSFVLENATRHQGPSVICGDLNTTIPKNGLNRMVVRAWHQLRNSKIMVNGRVFTKDERMLVDATAKSYGFQEALNTSTATWSPFKTKKWEPFSLKLDWFLIKNLAKTNVVLEDYISDHRAIRITLNM